MSDTVLVPEDTTDPVSVLVSSPSAELSPPGHFPSFTADPGDWLRTFHPNWTFINSWISVFMWSAYPVIWPYDSWTSSGFNFSSLSHIFVHASVYFELIKTSSFLTLLFPLSVSSWPLSLTCGVKTPFLLFKLPSPVIHKSMAPLSFCSIQQPDSKPGSGDFSGGPVVKTRSFHCRGRGFHSWSGS